MARGRRKAKDIDPYLSTSDFYDISGVTSMTLRTYENNNLIEAAYRSEADGYKYWTLDQVPLIELIDTMRSGGASVSDIAQTQLLGKEALLKHAYDCQAAKLRRDRRTMKAIVHTRNRYADLQRVSDFGGGYLRYLPLRWLAIAPLLPHKPQFSENRQFMRTFQNLVKVVAAVGWCPTMTFGTLVSVSADGTRASRYAYVELASPPMPETTGLKVIDGGCYRVFEPSFNADTCDGSNCLSCSRFGSVPSKEDEYRWGEASRNPELFDRVLRIEDIAEPIAKGDTWEAFKRSVLAQDSRADAAKKLGDSVAYGPRGEASDSASCAVPCRMPLGVRLPAGVTACSLPAGVHLCKQISFEDTAAKRRFLDFAKSLSPSPRTPQEIADSLGSATSPWSEPVDKGPLVEPFAVPRTHGVSALEGFARELTDDQARKLLRVQPAGLELEDGFCATSSNMVMSYDQSVTQEYHVLIDPEGFLEQ